MPKRATAIHVNEQEREELTRLPKRHRSDQHVVQRARIILAAAQGSSNIHIAHDLGINVDTVRLWRDRWTSQEAQNAQMNQGKEQSVLSNACRMPLALERFPNLRWNNGLRWLLWLARLQE